MHLRPALTSTRLTVCTGIHVTCMHPDVVAAAAAAVAVEISLYQHTHSHTQNTYEPISRHTRTRTHMSPFQLIPVVCRHRMFVCLISYTTESRYFCVVDTHTHAILAFVCLSVCDLRTTKHPHLNRTQHLCSFFLSLFRSVGVTPQRNWAGFYGRKCVCVCVGVCVRASSLTRPEQLAAKQIAHLSWHSCCCVHVQC